LQLGGGDPGIDARRGPVGAVVQDFLLARMASATHWLSVSPCSPRAVIHLTVSSKRRVWLGKVTLKDEIRSSNRGGLIPAVSSESSMERMPEPRFSQDAGRGVEGTCGVNGAISSCR
jgi:hypothetical protein